MKTKCTLKKCNTQRPLGDSLFCVLHRRMFRDFVKSLGIETTPLGEADEKILLQEYRKYIGGEDT